MCKKKAIFVNFFGFSEYFNWRSDYKVVFLDGKIHDVLERPWGFCQVRNRERCPSNLIEFSDMSVDMGKAKAQMCD